MGLRFRLRGLAETLIDNLRCPCCGVLGFDDSNFSTDMTKVTKDGIIVIAQCKSCNEIFIPLTQRLGILHTERLRNAVEKEHREVGSNNYNDIKDVKLYVEKLNAERRGELH
jgi:hypothetical protein